jgi:hypothetical protein
VRERIAWAIAVLAGAVAIFEAWNWHEYGWETPHQHEYDVQGVVEAVEGFKMQWVCDEDQEELQSLLGLPERNALQLDRVRQLADKIDENDCHVFE